MISDEIIQIVKQRLVDVYKPLIIYIFGSYAWGNPDDTSDLDLMIIIKDSKEKLYKRVIPAYMALKGLKISKDILIYTQDEFNQLAAEPSSFCNTIKSKGIKLYEAA